MDQVHAQAMEQVGAGILAVAAAEEKKLDAQLKDMENLGWLLSYTYFSDHTKLCWYFCCAYIFR
jgi:hypothetical protein